MRTYVRDIMVILSAAVALTILNSATFAQQVDLGTSDEDVWVYPRAGDPGGDPVIRCWGHQGFDLNPTGYPGTPDSQDFFSYGYVLWNVEQGDLPPDYSWNGMTLTITIADGSTFDPAQDNVYIRGLSSPFEELSWFFGDPPAPIAGPRLEGVVNGDGSPGDTITFSIPRSIPNSILQKWSQDRAVYLTVTSDADVFTTGRFLRFASNDNLIYDGPQLVLD